MERMRAPQRLFVLGAGDDAKPLVQHGGAAGVECDGGGGRAQLARTERFTEAEKVGWRLGGGAGDRGRDAVVVMTHSYEQDRALLTGAVAAWAARTWGCWGRGTGAACW